MSSYPTAAEPRWGWERADNAAVHAVLQPRWDRYEQARESIDPHLDFFARIPVHGDTASLHWDNGFWGGLDAGYQCAALIDRAPARYVEVGSGYSTMFARRTIDEHGLATTITSVDPAPRAEVDALCDRVVRQPVQDVALDLFTSLRPGDIVLFDGSHEAYMGADAVVMLLEILPALPAGVLVGIDDVFLPWDYPPEWSERLYGEQYLLGAFLTGGAAGVEVVLPAFYLTRADEGRHRFDERVLHLGSFGKTFWMQRV